MTLQELSQRNEKFQLLASEMAELLPGSNLLAFSSNVVRCTQKLQKQLTKVLNTKSTHAFYNQVDVLEEEIDELIFLMDRLDEANRTKHIEPITNVVKQGYEIVSLYSLCCDQLLEKKTKTQDEFE